MAYRIKYAADAEHHLRGLTAAPARYERILAAEYAQYHATKTWFYRLEQRWPASPFW